MSSDHGIQEESQEDSGSSQHGDGDGASDRGEDDEQSEAGGRSKVDKSSATSCNLQNGDSAASGTDRSGRKVQLVHQHIQVPVGLCQKREFDLIEFIFNLF